MAGHEDMKGSFVRVAELSDIPAGGRKVVKSHGKQIAIFRPESECFYAIDNRCPHEGYPLSEGTLKDGQLTCDWHNWKFDLRDGACLRGGEQVRSYPVRVEEGGVFLDLTDEDPAVLLPVARRSFEEAVEKRDLSRVARDALRLLGLGVAPAELITFAAEHAAQRLEWGWDHGLTVAAECVRALPLYKGAQAVIPITQAVAAVTDRSVRMPIRKGAPAELACDDERDRETFRRLVEDEQHDRAEALFERALAEGMGPEEAKRWLFPVVSDHFLNYGHGLIYTVRALQMLELIGWEHAGKLLPCLVFQITWGTREDRLPYMRRFQAMMAEIEPELGALFELQQKGGFQGSFDGESLFERLLEDRLEEGQHAVLQALRVGVPFAMIVDEIAAAAAERCLRFDVRIDRDPAKEEGWLDVTHTLTFANAVRTAFAMAPSPELLRALFQAARFVNSVHKLDRPSAMRATLPEPVRLDEPAAEILAEIERAIEDREVARALALSRGYIASGSDEAALGAWLTRFAIADSATVDIMIAHAIKMSVAALEELAAIKTPRRELPILGAIRFLASPKRERWVYPSALRALDFLGE
jgi:nitrite reductase/ring-hydroxylating ferredoxin subunit